MKMRLILVLCAGLALTVGMATATAEDGPGNSDAAKACQKGGWQDLVREDGTEFKNTGDCVSYAAQGGMLEPKQPDACVAGSEDFSDDAEFSQPTTFSGGTIDTAYGFLGNIRIQPDSWDGGFAAGTHLVWTGFGVNSFQLTFTNAVGSVTVEAQSETFQPTTDTLTAFDASDNVVGTDSAVDPENSTNTLTVTSASDNIKYFTIATDDDEAFQGIGFSNIVWTCN
jgi:hypothetical protein